MFHHRDLVLLASLVVISISGCESGSDIPKTESQPEVSVVESTVSPPKKKPLVDLSVVELESRRVRGELFDLLDDNRDGTLTTEEVSPDVAVHLVVGAKGSRFDLVLHALYSIDPPSGGPVPYRFYKKFISYKNDQGQRIEGEMSPFVKVAVPYCLGDSYRGFRVIGTTPDMCGGAIPVKRPGKELGAPEFADGRNFRQEEFFSAVIGSVVAEKCGLKVGDQIQPAHGTDEGSATHAKKFHVTGVLKPTGSSIDRSVYINLEGFYLLEGHALPPDGDGPKSKDVSVALVDGDKIDGKTFVPLPEERREVSAILVIAKDDTTAMALRDGINEGSEAVAASSVRVLIEFLTGGRSRFYELGIALKLSGGKLDRKQFSTGLQLRPIDGRK